MGQSKSCTKQTAKSGVISYAVKVNSGTYELCWTIEVPHNTYLRLMFKKLALYSGYGCTYTYVKITVAEKNENYIYCQQENSNWKPITTLNDINITFYQYVYSSSHMGSFEVVYHIEDLLCSQKNHFRCSNDSCIHQSQVCDRIKDCENGIDEIGCGKGVLAVKGVNISRENAINWMFKGQRSDFSFNWGKNTHRAITALFLAEALSFRGENLEEKLMKKQLELQTSVALLRNSTDPLSVNELSMFVNALTVTCHNPRKFYGYDLLQILNERVSTEKSPSPRAYLTLCNSNWSLTEWDIQSLLKLLNKHSVYPFLSDIQAMTVMALTCAKNKTKEFTSIANASKTYNDTTEKFIDGQLSDGSFGNLYTTAMITQALIASEQEDNKRWNITSTMQYLMKQLNSSSVDFLSAYLALPIFNGRSLVDIKTAHCSNSSREQIEDNEIPDVVYKLGGKMRVQYSLYIGDEKHVIHTIFLRMPSNSSAHDVMRIAQIADPQYKFLYRDVSGYMYIYEIAGITNDPDSGKFWLLFTGYNYINITVKHHTESPDKFFLSGEEKHLIMWYKTAHI